jgi:hypothetical protein
VVDALLMDHRLGSDQGVGRRDHVADEEVAEVVAAHRDRDGEIGLGPEADREDRREMVLPGSAERLRILGRLEPQAGDRAAGGFVAGRGGVGRAACRVGRHTVSLNACSDRDR